MAESFKAAENCDLPKLLKQAKTEWNYVDPNTGNNLKHAVASGLRDYEACKQVWWELDSRGVSSNQTNYSDVTPVDMLYHGKWNEPKVRIEIRRKLYDFVQELKNK